MKTFLLASLVLLLPAVSSAACGPSDVCDDIEASLSGEVVIGSVKIEWSTDAENSTVDFYRVLRWETDPLDADVVGSENAVGTCNTNEDYEVTDTQGGSQYTYTVEVWDTSNFRHCAVDVVPQ